MPVSGAGMLGETGGVPERYCGGKYVFGVRSVGRIKQHVKRDSGFSTAGGSGGLDIPAEDRQLSPPEGFFSSG